MPPVTPIVALYGVPTAAVGGEDRLSETRGSMMRLTWPEVLFAGVLASVLWTVNV